ncbi:DMT family transporter [Paenibacillus cremeus]|uniref:DMT family transporter n=1 Tax=Paenibacillus cremeus TaxID=2163881 RepID=A0A559KBQ0_9BACL|nr:DMT family transporter [Paenibacillus cremeus]TVY09560.1 DMT family transporter [Paenibacillus cremeus]
MKTTPTEATKNPYILMPILLLMWGSFAAVNKLLLRHLDSYQVLFYTYGIAAVSFSILFIVWWKRKPKTIWTGKSVILLMCCGVFTFLYDILYVKALEMLPAVEASMLNYLFPIFIVLFAVPMNHEKLNKYKVISIILGFAGTLLLVTKGDLASLHLTNLLGDLMAIAAAVCWGLYTNLLKKNTLDLFHSTLIITITASLLSTIGMALNSRFTVPSLPDFSYLAWISLSTHVVGFFLYYRALQYASASLVASFTYFTPFITLGLIVLMLGEKLTPVDLTAFALICLGMVYSRKVKATATG